MKFLTVTKTKNETDFVNSYPIRILPYFHTNTSLSANKFCAEKNPQVRHGIHNKAPEIGKNGATTKTPFEANFFIHEQIKIVFL